jgi:hypothetical protein
MFAQRALRAPLQMSARGMRPMAFRAAAIAPFHTKPVPVQQQKQQQAVTRSKWFAPPPAPGNHMVGSPFERAQRSTWRGIVVLTLFLPDSRQGGDATARPFLLRQRGRLRLHDHPAPHLRLLQVHPACAGPAVRSTTFHKQALGGEGVV